MSTPTSVSVIGLTPTTGTLQWEVAVSTRHDYDIIVSSQALSSSVLGNATTPCTVTAATPGVVIFVSQLTINDATTYALTGLTEGTHYYAYIRQNGEAQYEDHSAWVTYEFSTPCAATSVLPVTADFDGGSYLPSCWSAGAKAPSFTSVIYHGESGNSLGLSATAQEGCYVYSPVFASNAHAYNLTAFVYGAAGATYRVGVAASTDLLSIEQLYEGTVAIANSWEMIDVVIPADIQAELEQGLEYVWVIYNSAADNAKTFYVDDATIQELPSCVAPAGLSAFNILGNSISLTWTERGTATAWVVQYAHGTDTVNVEASTNPITINGLLSNASYAFRVKSACSATESSAWTPFIVAKTAVSLPFVEDFNELEEGVPEGWDNSEYTCGEDERWYYSATGHVGAGLSFDAYDADEGTTATLKTPAIANGDATNLTLSYYMKNGGSCTLDVYVSADGGLTFPQHIVTAQTGSAAWAEYELPFTVAANGSVMVKFVATSDYGYYEMYLDDVSVVRTATCAKPKNLRIAASTGSDATLAWTAGDEETSWELKYKLGTNDLQTVVVNNTPEYTITGLEANTSYTLSELALRAICSATDSSYVVSFNNITFRTPCGVIDLPYTNNFDQTAFPGDCWTESYHLAGTAGGWSRTASGAYSGAGCAQLADASAGNRNVIASPFFHSDAANTLRVSFWIYRASDYYTYEDEGVRVWVNTIATDTLGGTPLIHVARAASVGGDGTGIKVPAVASAGWYRYTAEIPAVGDVCLLFEGISQYGAATRMDEVTIEAIPTCERPDAVSASAVSATEVAVEITDNDSAHTAWEVVVGAVGFDPTTATPIAVNARNTTVTAPFTMVGLSSYEAYVRAVCAADDKSSWAGPSTFVYTDWSPLASGISFTSPGQYPWTLTQYAGEYYAASGNQHITSSVSDLVASLVVPENTKTTVSFDWSTEAYSYYEGFVIYIDEANPTLTNYDTDFGKQGGSYGDYHVEGSYNVVFTTPGTHTIRFRHLYNGTYASDSDGDSQSKLLAISRRDVSCVEPSVFNMGTITSTSAVLNWNNTGADNWEVAVFDATQSTINTAEAIVYQTVIGESTLTIEGLTPNTAYYAYVRSNCGTRPSDWSAVAEFRTECAARAIPFEESFENAGADLCWKIIGDAVTKSAVATGFDATKSLQVYNDSVAGMLVSPRFDVTSLAEYEVNLAINLTAKRYHDATIKPLTIGVMTDPSDVSTYIDLGDINIPSANGWKEYRFSLADLATPDYADWANAQYVVISMSDSATYLFDAITVAAPSSCPKPTALDVEAIGENSVVSWVSDATAHYAEIALGDSVVFAGNVQNPFTPALDANTTYKVRVRAVCGEENSAWTPWVVFKTPCALATLPYSENFDSYTNAPTASYSISSPVVPDCWDVQTNTSVVSVATSTTYAYSGTKALIFYGKDDKIVALPSFAADNQPLMLSVYYRTESASAAGNGTFQLGYLAVQGDASSFVAVQSAPLTTTKTKVEAIIPASEVANPAIKYVAGTAANWYAAIDDVNVIVAPTCPKPTNVHLASFNADSAVVAWNAGDEETEWELIYKLGNQTADTVVVNGASNYAVKNLVPNTSYSLSVLSLRAICSATDSSDVATGSLSFKTPCATEVLPLEEDFSNGISDCWSRFYNLAFTDGVSTATASTTTSGWNTNNKVFTNEVKVNIYGTTCKYWLVTPSFRVNDAAATLAFDMALTKYDATTAVTAGQQADDKFIVAISTDGSTWSLANATVWSNDSAAAHVYDSIPNTGEHVVLPLAAYVGQLIRVAFYGESTVSGGDNDLHLANVVISEPVDCDRPTAAAASDITQTSATITITDEGGSAWEYVINDQEATPTAVSTASFELTGLSAMTEYTVYVRRNCGNGNVSAWRSTTFMTACGVMTVPFVEDFEDITTISSCWHQEQTTVATGTSGTNYGNNCWKVYTSGSATTAHASTHSLQLQDTRAGTHTILALPAVHSDSVNALEFTFWMYRTTGTSYADEGVKVWVNNAPSLEGATALLHVTRCGGVEADALKVNPITSAGWYEYSCALPMAGDIYVILEGISQYGASSYVDDIKIAPAPTCRKPADLLFRQTTSTTVMLEIDDPDGSAWEYAVDSTANPVAVSDSIFTITGLTPGTNYEVFVRRVCSADDKSEWISADVFTTGAAVDAMYEDLNNSDTRMQGWVRLYTSNTSYPSVDSTSGVDGTPCWYVDGDTSTPYNGIFAMREVTGDISGYRFMVDAKKSTATNAGDIIIGVADAVGSQITYVDTITPNSTEYTTYVADFTSYTGTGKFPILFMSNLQTTTYLDNFVVEPIPSCDRPVSVVASNATAVSVDVVINDTVDAHTAWEAVIVDHGANPSTGTPVALNSKTATLEGTFTSTVAYDLYVRAVCDANDKSSYTGPVTFKFVDFSAVTTIPLAAVGDYPWTVNSSNHLESTNQGVDSSTSDVEATFIVPEGSIATVTFQYSVESEGPSTLYDYLCFYIDEANPSTSNYNSTFGKKGGSPAATGTGTFTLTEGTHKVLFRYYKDISSSTGADAAQIWNFVVTYSSFYQPKNLGVDSLTATSAKLTWSAGNDAVRNEVRLMSNTSNTTTTTTDNFLNVTGLTPEMEYQFRVRSFAASGDSTAWSAAYAFTTPTLCPKPQGLDVLSLTPTQVDLVINDADSAHTAWQIAFGAQGFNPDSANAQIVDADAKIVSIVPAEPLVSDNYYDLYVRTNCGDGILGNWTTVKTVHYVDLSATTNTNLNLSEGDYPWEVVVEGSITKLQSTNNGHDSTVSDMTTTVVVGEGERGSLSFNYYAQAEGATTMYDYLAIYIDEASPSTSNYVTNFGNNGRVGTPTGMGGVYTVSLAPGTHTIRWRFYKDSSSSTGLDRGQVWNINFVSTSAWAPDSISLDDVTPQTASISWVSCPNTLKNEVKVGEQILETAVDSIVLTGLTPNTLYNIQIRSILASDTTLWSNFAFRTACDVMQLPLAEGFNDGTWRNCWTNEHMAGTSTTVWGTSASSSYVAEGDSALYISFQSTGNSVLLASPQFAENAGATYRLSFSLYHTTSSTYANETMTVSVEGATSQTLTTLGFRAPNEVVKSGKNMYDYVWTAQATDTATVNFLINFANGYGYAIDQFRVAPITKADTIFDTTCAGSDYEGYGFTIPAANLNVGNNIFSYVKDAVTAQETDTLFILSLFVSQATSQSFTDTICAHQHYTGYGFDIADADPLRTAPYVRHLTNQFGCDSTVSLTLFVPQTEFAETKHMCEGQNYVFGDTTLTTSGTYVRTFTNQFGCDSTITLQIFFHGVASSLEASICPGDTYTFGNQTLDAAGTYTHTFTNAAGCDSVVTLTLSINQPAVTYFDGVFCEGTTFAGGSISPKFMDLTAAGTYTDTLKSVVTGCDSILVLNLVMESAQHTTVNGTYSDSKPFVYEGTSYQEAGTYTVTLTTVNGCDSIITLIITKENTALDNLEMGNLQINPNPVFVGQEAVISTEIAFTDDYVLRVFDAVGRLVVETTEANGRVPGLPVAGMYTVRIVADQHTYQTKLLVK